jgi:hypothetical protein
MSGYDFSKWDSQVDMDGLKRDIQEAGSNSGGDFKEVPLGIYEIKIKKLELKASKKGDPMVSCWMQILAGDFKGSMLFMNQVITRGFQIHIVNEFLRSLQSGISIDFLSYSQYAQLLMDVAEAIDNKKEYAVDYGEKNGFNTFRITDVFELTEA